MLRDQHRYLEAATHLEQAIVLAPERAKYHFYLGEVRRATGDFAGALAAFQRTLELAPDHLEARYYHSDLLVRNQQLSQARAGFADLLARDPDHIQGGLGLGGLLIRLGEPAVAIPVLVRVAVADPHNPAPHYLLAQAYTECDRPADARNAQGRFQQLSAAERHLNQGNIYIRQGAWGQGHRLPKTRPRQRLYFRRYSPASRHRVRAAKALCRRPRRAAPSPRPPSRPPRRLHHVGRPVLTRGYAQRSQRAFCPRLGDRSRLLCRGPMAWAVRGSKAPILPKPSPRCAKPSPAIPTTATPTTSSG